MTKAVRITLITAASTLSAGVIGAVSYVVGKKKGYELGIKQAWDGEAPGERSAEQRNTRTAQAQA